MGCLQAELMHGLSTEISPQCIEYKICIGRQNVNIPSERAKKMLSKHFKKAICLALSAPPLVSTFETKSCKTCLTFCLYSAALHRNFEPLQIVEN